MALSDNRFSQGIVTLSFVDPAYSRFTVEDGTGGYDGSSVEAIMVRQAHHDAWIRTTEGY